jgi:hypothetical protein
VVKKGFSYNLEKLLNFIMTDLIIAENALRRLEPKKKVLYLQRCHQSIEQIRKSQMKGMPFHLGLS